MEDTGEKLQVSIEHTGEDVFHKVKNLPRLAELKEQVKRVVTESSYWEKYGYGLLDIGSAIPLHFFGLYLCSYDQPVVFLTGFMLCGLSYSTLVNRAGHLAAHNALFETPIMNRIATYLMIEQNGFFSVKAAMDIHIQQHHPYTNIIGIGDSSSWKAPMLPRYVYMFFAPIFVPVMAPFVSMQNIYNRPSVVLQFLVSVMIGLTYNIYFIMTIAGVSSVSRAIFFMFAYRAITSLSYIHINIFQHIGLPMYTLKDRPSKIYQMSTGVLNLNRNVILDWIMGHTLVNCHVEHHLFSSLSDNMVLKIKPLVSKFLTQNGLPYNEKTYSNRLHMFVRNYDELMVKAPPITHFVGLQ